MCHSVMYSCVHYVIPTWLNWAKMTCTCSWVSFAHFSLTWMYPKRINHSWYKRVKLSAKSKATYLVKMTSSSWSVCSTSSCFMYDTPCLSWVPPVLVRRSVGDVCKVHWPSCTKRSGRLKQLPLVLTQRLSHPMSCMAISPHKRSGVMASCLPFSVTTPCSLRRRRTWSESC